MKLIVKSPNVEIEERREDGYWYVIYAANFTDEELVIEGDKMIRVTQILDGKKSDQNVFGFGLPMQGTTIPEVFVLLDEPIETGGNAITNSFEVAGVPEQILSGEPPSPPVDAEGNPLSENDLLGLPNTIEA